MMLISGIAVFDIFFQPAYSLGGVPNCFLKLAEKCGKVLNPVISAISEIFYFPSRRSSAARLSL